MGCGTGRNFVRLLERYPEVQYIGVEPSAGACAAARRTMPEAQATIHNSYAYDLIGKIVPEPVDIIVSFSVLEHVYQRQRYLETARACLKPEGHMLINYDAGHFVHTSKLREFGKNIIGPLLAPLGIERYYQRFVPQADFRRFVQGAGLAISEEKFFNTALKGVHKHVPAEHADEHMQRWLDYEVWLNTLGIVYDDRLASTFVTRNYILRHITPTA
jgi:SAM-dependent methyltransferase